MGNFSLKQDRNVLLIEKEEKGEKQEARAWSGISADWLPQGSQRRTLSMTDRINTFDSSNLYLLPVKTDSSFVIIHSLIEN